jgi:hypothetical protein
VTSSDGQRDLPMMRPVVDFDEQSSRIRWGLQSEVRSPGV